MNLLLLEIRAYEIFINFNSGFLLGNYKNYVFRFNHRYFPVVEIYGAVLCDCQGVFQ